MITPHIKVENDADGVKLTMYNRWLVLPPEMANELAETLITYAELHDPLAVTPLPEVKPTGDPIK